MQLHAIPIMVIYNTHKLIHITFTETTKSNYLSFVSTLTSADTFFTVLRRATQTYSLRCNLQRKDPGCVVGEHKHRLFPDSSPQLSIAAVVSSAGTV